MDSCLPLLSVVSSTWCSAEKTLPERKKLTLKTENLCAHKLNGSWKGRKENERWPGLESLPTLWNNGRQGHGFPQLQRIQGQLRQLSELPCHRKKWRRLWGGSGVYRLAVPAWRPEFGFLLRTWQLFKVECPSNLRSQWGQAGDSLKQQTPGSMRNLYQKSRWRAIEEHSWKLLWSKYVHTCTHMAAYTCIHYIPPKKKGNYCPLLCQWTSSLSNAV